MFHFFENPLLCNGCNETWTTQETHVLVLPALLLPQRAEKTLLTISCGGDLCNTCTQR